ncbi:MAG TPA: hypothetical protein VM123_16415 [archaeon]|nr:hypothetical protein [archaeon]
MSVLRLYEDSELTQIVSKDGDFTNPDDESSIDGTNGETKQKALWVAVEQTTLGAAITDTETQTVTLSAARFADTDYSVIIVDSEKMLITSGHGTTTLTVTRGYNGTTPATHSNGTAVYLAYDCTSITIDCADNTGTDESGWVTYCDDSEGSPDGSWEAPHSISNLNYNQNAAIWRKVVVPASTPASYKQDLIHRIAATVNETT